MRAPCGMTDILILPYPDFLFSFVMLDTFATGEKIKRIIRSAWAAVDDTLAHEDVWLSEKMADDHIKIMVLIA